MKLSQRVKVGVKTPTQLQEEREREVREGHTRVHLQNLELLNAIRDSQEEEMSELFD